MRGHLRDAPRGAPVLAFGVVVVLAVGSAIGCGASAGTKDAAAEHPDRGMSGASGAGGRTDSGLADRTSGQGGAAGAASIPDRVLADAAAPLGGTPLDTFDTDLDVGFEPYHDTAAMNLADPAVADGGTAPLLQLDPDQGSPSPGSLKIVVPFSGANQYVEIQSYVFVVPQDWSGRTLHVRLKVDAGSTFRGVAMLYVDTGVSYVGGSTAVNVAPGSDWQEIAMDVDHPASVAAADRYSAKQVVLYGLQLNSGSSGGGAGPVTFHVDSFSLD